MKKRIAVMILALSAGAWGAAIAQPAAPPRMMDRGPGWGRAGMGPQALLRQRSRLELTDEQVSQLEEMAERLSAESREAALAVRSQRAQLAEALGAESVDLAQVRAHFDSARAAQTRLEWMRIESNLQALGVLTDDQKAAVRNRPGFRGQRFAPNRRMQMWDRQFRPRDGRGRRPA